MRAFLIVSLIVLFSGFIIFLISWNIAFNNNGETKLNLSTFRKIYKINPRKWSVKEKWEDSINHLYYQGHKVKLSFLAFWIEFSPNLPKTEKTKEIL